MKKIIRLADKTIETANAEIERLNKIAEQRKKAYLSKVAECVEIRKTAKSEAYREFAELAVERVDKAKQKYQRLCKEQGEEMEEHMHIHFNGITKIIDNLLKELVGEDDG